MRLARDGSPARPGEARADMTQAVVAGTSLSLAVGLSSSKLLPPSIPGSPWWQQAAVQGCISGQQVPDVVDAFCYLAQDLTSLYSRFAK